MGWPTDAERSHATDAVRRYYTGCPPRDRGRRHSLGQGHEARGRKKKLRRTRPHLARARAAGRKAHVHHEARAVLELGLDADRAAVALGHDVLRDREAEARAALDLRGPLARLRVRLEDARLVLLADPRPVVLDRELDAYAAAIVVVAHLGTL